VLKRRFIALELGLLREGAARPKLVSPTETIRTHPFGVERLDIQDAFQSHPLLSTEKGASMGMWDSVRTAVDRVTGSSANVSVETDADLVRPGQSVTVRITVKNGLSALEARALLLEIEGVESIDLPRYANWANVVEDVATATSKSGVRSGTKATSSRNSAKTFEATVTVSPGLSLAVGEERKFQGTFRLPANVQPTYQGRYANHVWRMRARLDVFGTDPNTGWRSFRVIAAQ
jgi:hypothetical protein